MEQGNKQQKLCPWLVAAVIQKYGYPAFSKGYINIWGMCLGEKCNFWNDGMGCKPSGDNL